MRRLASAAYREIDLVAASIRDNWAPRVAL